MPTMLTDTFISPSAVLKIQDMAQISESTQASILKCPMAYFPEDHTFKLSTDIKQRTSFQCHYQHVGGVAKPKRLSLLLGGISVASSSVKSN